MHPQEQKCHVIVIHYGAPKTTLRALKCLNSGTLKPDTILIVDNAEEPISVSGENVKVVRPKENAGYAGGINFGLGVLVGEKTLEDDVVIVMNNDVVVSTQTIKTAVDYFNGNKKMELVGAEMREVNLVTGRTLRLASLAQGKLYSLLTTTYTLNYLHGAFLAAPMKLWSRMQGLPTEYFMYWEDAALGYRLSQSRFKYSQLKKLDIHYQEEKEPSANHLYYLVRNGAYWLEKKSPKPWRYYWWLMNRLRLFWHRYFSGKKLIVVALSDATSGALGRRKE